MILQGGVKEETLKNLECYVMKDARLPMCLHKYVLIIGSYGANICVCVCVCVVLCYRLRATGITTFIATNSDYKYTKVW